MRCTHAQRLETLAEGKRQLGWGKGKVGSSHPDGNIKIIAVSGATCVTSTTQRNFV